MRKLRTGVDPEHLKLTHLGGGLAVAAACLLGTAACGGGGGGGAGSGVDAGTGGGANGGGADGGNGASTDDTPPEFAGVQTAAAASTTSVRVGWEPATDDVTPPESIDYLVYVSDASGGHDFSEADVIETGVSRVTVEGLQEETTYFFVVRARDQAGNADENTEEVSADTSEPDTTPPSFEGVEAASALSATEIELSWSAASDDTTPAGDIVYNVYASAESGGQGFADPDVTTSAGATSAVLSGLSAGATYFAVVRAEDLSGNEEENSVEASATTQQVSFSTDVQPIFSTSCAERTCHAGARPKGELDLSDGEAYANLVEVASSQCENLLRVAPGDPGASYLLRKLTGDRSGCFSGQEMPPGGALSASELEVIRAWIEGGAADD